MSEKNSEPKKAAPIRSLLESSFQFHASLERPGAFLRREWRAIAVAAGAYVFIMLGILFAVEPSFFYPRIETDQLNYLLKAKSLVETGSTAARWAVNLEPFSYAAMPGVLRAPFLFLFNDFDEQLRGIQLMNLGIVAITALMSAYMLSWVLAPRFHKWAIVFAFGFVLLSPDWMTNVFVPLADAPYAALTLGSLIVVVLTLTSAKPVGSQPDAIALFIVLFTAAFFVRFTAPVILVAVICLALTRWDVRQVPRRILAMAIGIPMLAITVFVALNASAIFGRYLDEPIAILYRGNKPAMALNLFGSALPTQIVPVFNLGFQTPMVSRYISHTWNATPRDIVWAIVGILISAVIVRGMFAIRQRLAPELATFLAALPVLAIVIFSTTRYLMSYQPIIWICFVTGAAAILGHRVQRLQRATKGQIRIAAAIGAAVAIAGVVMLRSSRTARTVGAGGQRHAISSSFAYVNDVEATYGNLRSFIERLPRERSLLIGASGETGRFKVIANRDYYRPDCNLMRTASEKDVYAVLSCGTAAACGDFDRLIGIQNGRMERWGKFTYDRVYDQRTANARALVRRVRPVGFPTEPRN